MDGGRALAVHVEMKACPPGCWQRGWLGWPPPGRRDPVLEMVHTPWPHVRYYAHARVACSPALAYTFEKLWQ